MMDCKTRIFSLALIGGLASSAAIFPAFAEDAQAPNLDKVEQKAASDADLVKLSKEAALSMHAVRGARLAIFDGQDDAAGKMIDGALTHMQHAEAQGSKGIAPMDTTQPGAYVPFDLSMNVGADFTVTKQNEHQVEAAQTMAANGNALGAAKLLKASDVSVDLSSALIPADLATDQLKQAKAAYAKGDLQAANMALKDVEESVVFQNVDYQRIPDPSPRMSANSAAKLVPGES
ncbi:YfdX family protein [Thioclava litoralis]|uniref:YfdX family protein n=1 Tax=Thioclava litoralis TaxID=3076557 RepID=A0ABZ1E276_9RHOB|nr:YfdX family protein [Thioclava sp. FTW29]